MSRLVFWLHVHLGRCRRCWTAAYGEATADAACPWGYAWSKSHGMIQTMERVR